MPISDPVKRSEHQRRMKYQREYGITLEDYDRMYDEQNGRCAICRTNTPGGPGERFCVDHCHSTGTVRGLLCNNCNRALGHFKDDALLLQQAIKYLNEESN
jgi:hypothetical protein